MPLRQIIAIYSCIRLTSRGFVSARRANPGAFTRAFNRVTYLSTMSKPEITKTSICNCKRIELSVTGVDKGAVLCHCDNCQRASGSAFAHNHRLLSAKMTVKRGQDLIKYYADSNTKSGKTLNRHFCSNCVSYNRCDIQWCFLLKSCRVAHCIYRAISKGL